MLTLDSLKKEINEFCSTLLPSNVEKHSRGKILHDTTWGTNYFEPHEIELINTPLFQRLRYLNQMGFVCYVYPSARHSRFEHSLGVAILVERMFNCVHRTNGKLGDHNLLDSSDLITLRIAAILHDVGHCLFSHTSEMVYGTLLDKFIEEELIDKKPSHHEFLSYLILQSNSFAEYFNNLKRIYNLKTDIKEVASIIIGNATSEDKRYLTSFINGPFDADKIDYYHRDSQFSGIPIQLDLDRLFYEISISDLTNIYNNGVTIRDLTVGVSGVACIEQIIFNKMLLYSTIYNHQKVKSMDCMFNGLFEYMTRHKIHLKINNKDLDFSKPTDFLYITEYNFFSLLSSHSDPTIKRLIDNIINRKLLKRALVINHSTIKEPGLIAKMLSTGANRKAANDYLRDLAVLIHHDANATCDPCEIWINVPKPPPLKEATSTFVRSNRKSNEYYPLSDFYPYKEFNELYRLHKLNIHVFAPESCIKEISISARKILENELGLILKDNANLYKQ